MGFKIGKQISKEDAFESKVFYREDENGNQTHVKREDAQDSDQCVSFFLVPLTGRAQREISDRMMSVSKKGKTEMQTGTAEMIRVLRSVIAVEGMESATGRQLNRLTEDVYDAMPRWMLDEVLEDIHKLNGTDTVEDEDGNPVSSDDPFGSD